MVLVMTLNPPHITLVNTHMSSELFIPLLQQGNTGDEILAILDTLTAPTVPNTYTVEDGVSDAAKYGTLEDIDF